MAASRGHQVGSQDYCTFSMATHQASLLLILAASSSILWGGCWSLCFLLQIVTSNVSVIFCGHLGKEILDAVSLASVFINVFGLAILMGLTWACDTLFAQSFGSRNKANMGVVLQRGLAIVSLACLPITTIFMNAEHILAFTRQPEFVCRQAGIFIRITISALPAIAVWQVLRSFLFSQGIVHIHYIVPIVANIFNVGFHLFLVTYLKLEISGSAMAFSLTNWMYVGLYLLYIIYANAYEGMWNGWTVECFDRLCDFLSLAIPGMLMVFVEWGAGDVITFVSGLLGEVDLAAYTITYNLWLLMGSLPIGLQFGGSVRVGYHLGANDPEMARSAFWATIIILLPFSTLIALGLLSLSHIIPYVFTNDQEVAHLASTLTMWLSLLLFTTSNEMVLKGILRGVGELALGAVVNCIAYPVIAVPTAVPLMLKTNLRVLGGLLGMIAATVFQCIFYQMVVMRVNWKDQALKAQERAKIAPDDYLSGDSGTKEEKSQPHDKDAFEKLMTAKVAPLEFTIDVSGTKSYGTMDDSISGEETIFEIKEFIANLHNLKQNAESDKKTEINVHDPNTNTNSKDNEHGTNKTCDNKIDTNKNVAKLNDKNKAIKDKDEATKRRKVYLKLKFLFILVGFLIILIAGIYLSQYLTNLREIQLDLQKKMNITDFEKL